MVNEVTLIGNCGKDPEIRVTQSGKKVAQVTLATTETWKDQAGQKQEKTEWHNLVAWDPLAGIFERFIKKGSTIYIKGQITYRSWDDPSGQKKYRTEIVVKEMKMLSKKNDQQGGSSGGGYGGGSSSGGNSGGGYGGGGYGGGSAPGNASNPPPDDDLPF